MTSIPDITSDAPGAAGAPPAAPAVPEPPRPAAAEPEDTAGGLTDRLGPVVRQAGEVVGQNPVTSLLVAAGAGAVLGWLLKR